MKGLQLETKDTKEALRELANSQVVSLKICEAELNDVDGTRIAKAIKVKGSTVTSLDLSRNELGVKTASALANSMKNKHCRLLHLHLEMNPNIGHAGASQLAKGLSSRTCHLTSINLGDCELGDEGAKYIAAALANKNCVISHLNLSDNDITSVGVTSLCESLQERCTVKHLNLENNAIAKNGAKAVAAILCSANNTITSLDLSGNGLRDAGCHLIVRALQHKENKIIEIDLQFNELTKKGHTDIVDALKHINCQITELDQVSWLLWLLNHNFELKIITAVVEAHPMLANCKDRHGKLPLNHVVENQAISSSHGILKLTQLLFQETSSDTRDFNNRSRVDICAISKSELVLDWAEKIGIKYCRYTLDRPVKPRYKSKSSEVYFAVDVTTNQPVAIKMFWDKSGFESERSTREDEELSENFVVPALGFYEPEMGLETEDGDIDEDANALGGTGAPSWEGNRSEYSIIMPRCDRNLDECISMERIAGHDATAVVSVATQIAQCLDHLHSKNLIHGDVKPRNIVRCGQIWKLIDLDAACMIGSPIGRKLCSAYMPPELAKLAYDEDGQSIDVARKRRPQPKMKKITNRPRLGARPQPQLKKKNNQSAINEKERTPEPPTTLLGCARPSFDVWMFGCLLYELCTGHPLFATDDKCDDDSTSDEVRRELRTWTVIDNTRLSHVFQYENFDDDEDLYEVKEMARDLIRQCLQGDPLKRINSMQQVLNSNFCKLAGLRESKQKVSKVSKEGKDQEKEKEKKNKNPLDDSGFLNIASDSDSDESDDESSMEHETMYKDGSYAVIISIEAYQDEDGHEENLPKTHDGELMKATLQARNFQIIGELYDEQATSSNIYEMLDLVKNKFDGKPNARFCFFLVAKGYRDTNRCSWVQCHGVDKRRLHQTCIKMNAIQEFAKSLDCMHQLYVMDCDHSNSILLSTSAMPSSWNTNNISLPAIYGMTSFGKKQKRLVEGDHSIFTKSLADILNMESIREEKNCSVVEIFELVEDKVQKLADQKGKLQTPMFAPMCQLHSNLSCDGQMIFFAAEPVDFVAGSGIRAVRKKKSGVKQNEKRQPKKSGVNTKLHLHLNAAVTNEKVSNLEKQHDESIKSKRAALQRQEEKADKRVQERLTERRQSSAVKLQSLQRGNSSRKLSTGKKGRAFDPDATEPTSKSSRAFDPDAMETKSRGGEF